MTHANRKFVPSRWRLAASAICPAMFLSAAGCTMDSKPTTQPASWTEQASQDPYNYSPKWENADISGGDISHLDKQGMKRDIDDVLNP